MAMNFTANINGNVKRNGHEMFYKLSGKNLKKHLT